MIQPPLPHDPRDIVVLGAEALGIALNPSAVDAMLRHMDLVSQWRLQADLTALTDPAEAAVLHILDSLTVFKVIPRGTGLAILDIGSGGGFPGLVLKTADSSLRLTLLDRNPRKIVFLKHAVHELGLEGVKFANVRVEALLKSNLRERFDVVVSRAVFSETSFLASLTGLLVPRGSLVRMAGPASLRESDDLPGFRRTAVWEGTLPFSDATRRLLRYTPDR